MTSIGEVCGEFSVMEGNPMLEQGKNVKSPLPEEEGAAKTTRDGLTTTPSLCPPAPLVKWRKFEVKLILGERKNWREFGYFQNLFLFLIILL